MGARTSLCCWAPLPAAPPVSTVWKDGQKVDVVALRSILLLAMTPRWALDLVLRARGSRPPSCPLHTHTPARSRAPHRDASPCSTSRPPSPSVYRLRAIPVQELFLG